jgi:hypothetical protein
MKPDGFDRSKTDHQITDLHLQQLNASKTPNKYHGER